MGSISERADILIVGAGPAGSTAAALLAQRGWDVLMLDRARFPRDKTCGDGLTPRAVAVLERAGVLSGLEDRGYQRIGGALTVAPDGSSFHMRFGDYRLGLPDHGLVVPRFELDEALRQHAVTSGARFCAGAHVTHPLYEGQRVAGVEGEADGVPLRVQAPLTILATGASIGLLRSFGVLQKMPPGVNAVRGYFTGIPDLGDEFEFYFDRELSPGYAWVFPLADGRANVGLGLWALRRAETVPNTRRLLAEFLARHPRLAHARAAGPIKGYPLRTDYPLVRPAGPGYLLVGETLGLVHPTTGEGIDLAMESAEMAAHALEAAGRRATPDRAGALYSRAVRLRYASFFRGVHLLQRVATGPHAMNVLIGKAPRKPFLARTIAGINLSVTSPWQALSPRTWWDLLT